MMAQGYEIVRIEGIAPVDCNALLGAGIQDTRDLLDRGGAPIQREALATATGINSERILEWVNKADLMRISGIGPQFSELLEASGVRSVKELSHQNPAALTKKIMAVNREQRLARTSPPLKKVTAWIADAKRLAPRVFG